MIYHNDNITVENDKVIGTIKDLKEYFRYELASQCMTGEQESENFLDNAKNIIELLENLEEDLVNDLYTENDVLEISEHCMGGFAISSSF